MRYNYIIYINGLFTALIRVVIIVLRFFGEICFLERAKALKN